MSHEGYILIQLQPHKWHRLVQAMNSSQHLLQTRTNFAIFNDFMKWIDIFPVSVGTI